MEQNFDNLKKVRRVNVPPFLFTRIENGIGSLNDAPVQWKWALGIFAIFIVGINIGLILKTTVSVSETRFGEVITEMHLSTSNALYDE